LLHEEGGVRLAPMYDVLSTGVYPDLNADLALGIGDAFDPAEIGVARWSDLAYDLRLNPRAFERLRRQLAELVPARAEQLSQEAHAERWHRSSLDEIVKLTDRRAEQL
jgi:serine/threonine-protein kinase HipA